MRILAITTAYPSQAAPHRAAFMPERLRALAEAGAEVTVIVPEPWFPLAGMVGRRPSPPLPAGPVRVVPTRYFCLPGIGRNSRARQLLPGFAAVARRLHAAQAFDLVLAHFLIPPGPAAAAVAGELGLPLALVAHGSDVHEHARIPAQHAQILAAMRQARAVVVVSEPLRQTMLALGLPAEEALVLPCGYDPASFVARPRNEARRELGLGPGPWLVFPGLLRRIKRVDLILEALAQLPDVRLAVVGAGDLGPALADQAQRLGLGQRVLWAGAQPHARVPLWMSAADALVMASDHEGTPTVLVEAMALGVPVVATAVGGIPDLVGDAGRLVPPNDAGALAAAVRATLADPPPAAALQARVAHLTWPEIGRRELEFLRGRCL